MLTNRSGRRGASRPRIVAPASSVAAGLSEPPPLPSAFHLDPDAYEHFANQREALLLDAKDCETQASYLLGEAQRKRIIAANIAHLLGHSESVDAPQIPLDEPPLYGAGVGAAFPYAVMTDDGPNGSPQVVTHCATREDADGVIEASAPQDYTAPLYVSGPDDPNAQPWRPTSAADLAGWGDAPAPETAPLPVIGTETRTFEVAR